MGKLEVNFIENWKKLSLLCVTFTFGTLMIIFWPCVWDHVLMKQLELRPGTLIYKYWVEPPQPLYLDVYFFNWTNPHEFNNKSVKPNFVEIGPYRFQEYPQKVNVSFNDANSTVSYRKQSRYIFIADQSKGRLDDLITSVNVVSLSSANQARSWNIFKVKGVELSLAFFDQQIHITKTADELLFKGYDDPIITVAKEIAGIMGIDVPFNRFGWFYMRNESSLLTGSFNADTGVDDVVKMGKLRTWNYESRTSFFSGACGNLEGASAGEFFPPQKANLHDQTIQVFSPEMCRNIEMDFDSAVIVKGLKANKYIGGERTVDNGTKYGKNECYCSGECVPSGVINATSCRLGAPVFMSFPHFFNADPFYRDQVEGMNPIREKHEFSMTLSEKTSLPLEIKGRFQLNVLMNPIKNIKMYKNVQRKFLPVVWFEQTFTVDKNLAFLMKIALNIGLIGQVIGLISVFLSIVIIYIVAVRKKNVNNGSQIIRFKNNNNNNNNVDVKRLPENSPLMSKSGEL